MKNTPSASHISFTAALLAAATLLLCATAHAGAARCVNAAGAIVGYADSAAQCPQGSSYKGDVGAMPKVDAADQARAQAQASKDQQAVSKLEAQRAKEAAANARAQAAANKQDAGKGKRCKSAEIALKKAKDRYDDAPSASIKTKKPNKNNKTQTHTVTREGDEKAGKAKKKARHGLEYAQSKRDLACS
jgi:hypothetical protein